MRIITFFKRNPVTYNDFDRSLKQSEQQGLSLIRHLNLVAVRLK